MIGNDTYYSRKEVSNSDLGALKNYFAPKEFMMDLRDAYRFGNLIDAMLTESHRVDFYMKKVDGETFTPAEWQLAMQMKEAGKKDPMLMKMLQLCEGQMVMTRDVEFDYHGFKFTLTMRIKYDFFAKMMGWGGDLKSTAATSLKQFLDACLHFDYDRQRVVYMKVSGAKRDIIVGISKKNLKVFHKTIEEGDDFYQSGERKLTELAFKYWLLFGDLSK